MPGAWLAEDGHVVVEVPTQFAGTVESFGALACLVRRGPEAHWHVLGTCSVVAESGSRGSRGSRGSSARPAGGASGAVLARAVSAVGVGAVPRGNAVHAQGPERGSRAWHVNDRAGLRLCQAVHRARPSFDDAFRAEYPAVVRVVAPIVRSRADAEGVAQDAFVKAYTRWRRIGRYDRPGAWVRRVAIRDAVRVAERSRRAAAGTRAATSGPGDPADAVATQVDLTRLLGELPARQRACVVLHHLADWPVADVAQALGCAEATVRVHLHGRGPPWPTPSTPRTRS
jgi:RNA polymerase sigma-70 factor, ECF subfamily